MAGDQIWPLLAGTAAFCWMVVIAYARPIWVVALALALFAGEATFGAAPGVDVAGLVLYGRDFVFLTLLTAGAIRLALRTGRSEGSGVPSWAWWSLLALIALSVVRGVQSYGVNLAGNDFRPTFYLLAGAIGIAAQPKRALCVRDLVDVWIGVALLLVLIGMARTVGLTIGLPVDQQPFLDGRPLYAWPTLVIGQAALLSFFAGPLRSRWAGVPGLPYLFLIAVLIFRHRTVWATMVIAVVAMWTMLRPERPAHENGVERHWAGVVVTVVALLLLTGQVGSLERDLRTRTETAASEDSTFLWRIEGWKALLESQRANPHELVLGIPYGAGYHREVFDAEVEYSPHSWYVQTISRVGVLGCGFMLVILVQLFRRGRASGVLPRNLGALLVLSTAVYGISYHPPEVAGIVLGLVVLAARQTPARRRASEGPEHEASPSVSPFAGAAPMAR